MYCCMAVIQEPREDLIARGSEVQGDPWVVWNQSKMSNCVKTKTVRKSVKKAKINKILTRIIYIILIWKRLI